MYELRLEHEDVARVRFAISPLWEVCQAVRSIANPRQGRYHLPWLDQVESSLDDLDVAPLLAIQPITGYTPDLIAPLPEHPRTTVHEQIERVRATPLTHVRDELTRAFRDRAGEPVPAELRSLAQRPKLARARIADALESCWESLVAPYWPRIRDLLDADVAYHSRLLADHGLERLVPALNPALSWRSRALRASVGTRALTRIEVAGRGVLLQPSAFAWPSLIVIGEDHYQPTIVYPARGVAALWQPIESPSDQALSRLVGATRAALLASVREPASTTTLARRHQIAPATVSEHLKVLSDARLVLARRVGREVFYRTSPLGEVLLQPDRS